MYVVKLLHMNFILGYFPKYLLLKEADETDRDKSHCIKRP